ncbi:MAG TPA: hypothetical protein VGX48_27260 [Pyrinomonadaceae bacterium]|jgi:hypothetical protein|nr:hypothetical protein [Pyrinomonadaceae bacterium]
MAKFTSPLDHVRVAAPCPADWDRMVGDDRARFCNQCSLHVYNLSGMTRREAETFVSNAEGRVCVRYYRRRDGTILTKNCPVGLRAIRQKVSRVAGSVLSAVLGFYTGAWLHVGLGGKEPSVTMGATATAPPLVPPVVDDRPAVVPPLADVGPAVAGRMTMGEAYVPVKEHAQRGGRAAKRGR